MGVTIQVYFSPCTEKVRGLSWKYSSANFTLTVQAALATSPSDTCGFSVCAALIIRGVVSCHQRKQPWKYSKGNVCYFSVTNPLALIPSFFSPCSSNRNILQTFHNCVVQTQVLLLSRVVTTHIDFFLFCEMVSSDWKRLTVELRFRKGHVQETQENRAR